VGYELLLMDHANETIKGLSETPIYLILTYGKRVQRYLELKKQASEGG